MLFRRSLSLSLSLSLSMDNILADLSEFIHIYMARNVNGLLFVDVHEYPLPVWWFWRETHLEDLWFNSKRREARGAVSSLWLCNEAERESLAPFWARLGGNERTGCVPDESGPRLDQPPRLLPADNSFRERRRSRVSVFRLAVLEIERMFVRYLIATVTPSQTSIEVSTIRMTCIVRTLSNLSRVLRGR